MIGLTHDLQKKWHASMIFLTLQQSPSWKQEVRQAAASTLSYKKQQCIYVCDLFNPCQNQSSVPLALSIVADFNPKRILLQTYSFVQQRTNSHLWSTWQILFEVGNHILHVISFVNYDSTQSSPKKRVVALVSYVNVDYIVTIYLIGSCLPRPSPLF